MAGRQPPLGVLGAHVLVSRGAPRLAAAVVATGLLLSACSGGDDASSPASPGGASAAPTSPSATGPSPARATPVPAPATATCYRLSYDDAVAPSSTSPPVRCSTRHTSVTFESGALDTVVEGRLLAVDSQRVEDDVAARCPAALGDFLGGGPDALRLSMLRSVWFTPTLEEADAGASWYRCDVVALAGAERLADLTPPMRGTLATPAGRDRYGLCGTAEPGTAGFSRVLCSAEHSWRAVQVVGFDTEDYPGPGTARARGQEPCETAGRAAAEDPLDFSWGYEWPTREQWDAGQDHGLCWVPD